jgi:hypothetical protein
LIRNLWIASVEDFASSEVFMKEDLVKIIYSMRAFVANSLLSERPLYDMERTIITACSSLIRLMHDIFVIDSFIDPEIFKIKEVSWDMIITHLAFTEPVMNLINFIPECVPFKVRALLFTQNVNQER